MIREKFNTHFAFDTIRITGNTAFVCTHHPAGSVIINTKEKRGQKTMRYTFNTNPLQGRILKAIEHLSCPNSQPERLIWCIF